MHLLPFCKKNAIHFATILLNQPVQLEFHSLYLLITLRCTPAILEFYSQRNGASFFLNQLTHLNIFLLLLFWYRTCQLNNFLHQESRVVQPNSACLDQDSTKFLVHSQTGVPANQTTSSTHQKRLSLLRTTFGDTHCVTRVK